MLRLCPVGWELTGSRLTLASGAMTENYGVKLLAPNRLRKWPRVVLLSRVVTLVHSLATLAPCPLISGVDRSKAVVVMDLMRWTVSIGPLQWVKTILFRLASPKWYPMELIGRVSIVWPVGLLL